METRRQVERGRYAVHDLLEHDEHSQASRDVRRFLTQMRPPQSEMEQLAESLRGREFNARGHRNFSSR